MQTIKSPSGKTIGTIRQESGRLVARDTTGKMLGYYVEKENATRDPHGRLLAKGNILSALILQNAK
ncbi:MAG: hypothetical protein NZM06_08205 [Chloroherpetonaceae bacterium]|nr:hypothetical protein [Chloroherpetonaceae bacterium]